MAADKKPTIRVMLADDHPLLREGLRVLLEQEDDITVVAEAADGQEAVDMAAEIAPDVVIMDISMPRLNGVEATHKIVSSMKGTAVICLSLHRERHFVQAMLRAGARGYLLKTSMRDELVQAVHTVASGETHLSPAIATEIVRENIGEARVSRDSAFSVLSDREREVLQLIAEGGHTKGIADRLKISPKTVFAHRENIMKKLGIHSVAELTRYALREGICEL